MLFDNLEYRSNAATSFVSGTFNRPYMLHLIEGMLAFFFIYGAITVWTVNRDHEGVADMSAFILTITSEIFGDMVGYSLGTQL